MKDRLQPPTSFSRARRAVLPALGLLILGGSADCVPSPVRPLSNPTAISRPDTLPTPDTTPNSPRELSDEALVDAIQADIVTRRIDPDPKEALRWKNLRDNWQRTTIPNDPQRTSTARITSLNDFLKTTTENQTFRNAANEKIPYIVTNEKSQNGRYTKMAISQTGPQELALFSIVAGQDLILPGTDPMEVACDLIRSNELRRLADTLWRQQSYRTAIEAKVGMDTILDRYPDLTAAALKKEIDARVEQMGREGKIVPTEHKRAWEDIRYYYTHKNNPNFTQMWADYARPPRLPNSRLIQ